MQMLTGGDTACCGTGQCVSQHSSFPAKEAWWQDISDLNV